MINKACKHNSYFPTCEIRDFLNRKRKNKKGIFCIVYNNKLRRFIIARLIGFRIKPLPQIQMPKAVLSKTMRSVLKDPKAREQLREALRDESIPCTVELDGVVYDVKFGPIKDDVEKPKSWFEKFFNFFKNSC